MRRCSVCGEEKELDQFFRDRTRKDGYEARCKTCSTKLREARRLGYTTGIPRHLYDALLITQQNKCAICDDPPAEGKSLLIDHRHSDGTARGLLCPRCNSGLGMFQDRPDRLEKAAEYLRGQEA